MKPKPSAFRTDSDDDLNLTVEILCLILYRLTLDSFTTIVLSIFYDFRSRIKQVCSISRKSSYSWIYIWYFYSLNVVFYFLSLGELVDLGGDAAPNYSDNYDEPIIEEDDDFVLPPVS